MSFVQCVWKSVVSDVRIGEQNTKENHNCAVSFYAIKINVTLYVNIKLTFPTKKT